MCDAGMCGFSLNNFYGCRCSKVESIPASCCMELCGEIFRVVSSYCENEKSLNGNDYLR